MLRAPHNPDSSLKRPFRFPALVFLAWFFIGEHDHVIEQLGDAAVAGSGGAVIEDSEQLAAAVGQRHAAPSREGARIAGESELENGWKLAFGLHGGKELLGDLLGAAEAGGRAFLVWGGVRQSISPSIG